MVEITDINDRDSLEAWLEDKPREVSVWIASRAAARVLPVLWRMIPSNRNYPESFSVISVLQSLLIASVAVTRNNDKIKSAAAATKRSVVVNVRVIDARDRNSDVSAAVRAAGSASGAAEATSVFDAVHGAAAAVAASAAAVDVWQAVKSDLSALETGSLPDARPLWPGGPAPLAKSWVYVKAQVADPPDAADWQFWIAWYDALLEGRTMLPDPKRTWDMLEQIALIDPHTWDAGPETVNPEIRKIWERYLVEDVIAQNPLALRIARNEKTGKLESFPKEVRDLENIVTAIRQALREFTARCKRPQGGNNFGPSILDAFEAPIKDLRRDVGKYRNDPRQLFRVLEETRREMRLIAETEGFTRDSSIDRLLGNLEQQGEDICVSAPEVLEEVKQRLSVRVQLFKTEQITSAMRMTSGMIADSDGLLRSAAAQALLVIMDEARSEADKQAAWTFLLGALPRGAREMRANGEDGSKASDDETLLDRVAGYADKASKIDRGVDALQEAVSEGGPWVTEVYTQIASGNVWGLGGSG